MIYKCKVDFEKEILRYENLLERTDDERKVQIAKLFQVNDKIRSLLSRKLTEYAICHFANVSPSSLSFGKEKYGKPKLLSHPKIFSNVSHCDSWIICAVDKKPIGLDIEKIANLNSDTLEIFCSTSECNELKVSAWPELQYYQYWTIKEATLKLVGTGLLTDPKKVTVFFQKGSSIKVRFENKEWLGESIHTDDGYVLSAVNTNNISKAILVSPDSFY